MGHVVRNREPRIMVEEYGPAESDESSRYEKGQHCAGSYRGWSPDTEHEKSAQKIATPTHSISSTMHVVASFWIVAIRCDIGE